MTSRRTAQTLLLLALALGFREQSLAMGPFERNAPAVEDGLRAYDEGRYEDALRAFDAARRVLPGNPAIEYDRGNALYRLKRWDEAREAYHRVTEMAPGTLHERDLYNLGNALAEMGDRSGAIAAYRKALTLEPNDEAARHNLELLLRKVPPPRQGSDGGTDGGSDAGPRDGGPSDAGRDGGSDGGKGDAGGGDAGSGDAGASDGGPGKRQGPAPLEPKDSDGGAESDAGVPPLQELLDRSDAERLLDALKQNEKNFQLWRFQQRKKPRKPNEKDW